MKTIIITPESEGIRPHPKDSWYVWIGVECEKPTHFKFANGMNIVLTGVRGTDTCGGDIVLLNNYFEVCNSQLRTQNGSILMNGYSHFRLSESKVYLQHGRIEVGEGKGEVSMRDSCIFVAGVRLEVDNGLNAGFVNIDGNCIKGRMF